MSSFESIIEHTIYLTLATVGKDGEPWNTPLLCAYDADKNFYWGSHRDSQHSKNIRANGKVFITIYDSSAPAGSSLGAYIRATAEELTDATQIVKAHELLQARRPMQYWKVEQLQGDAPIRLYKATPEQMWTNEGHGLVGSYVDVRKEVSA